MTNTRDKRPSDNNSQKTSGTMPRKQTLIKGTKGKKDTEKEGKSKKAHLSYSLLLVHHHLLRAAFRLALD